MGEHKASEEPFPTATGSYTRVPSVFPFIPDDRFKEKEQNRRRTFARQTLLQLPSLKRRNRGVTV